MIKPLIPEMVASGSLKKRTLGIQAKQFEAKEKLIMSDYWGGVLVGKVYEKGAAKKSGLKVDDIIIESNGKVIQSIHDLEMELYSLPIGAKLKLTVIRNKKEQALDLRIQ